MILTRIILHFHYNKTSAISNQQSTSISAISLYRRHLRSSPSVSLLNRGPEFLPKILHFSAQWRHTTTIFLSSQLFSSLHGSIFTIYHATTTYFPYITARTAQQVLLQRRQTSRLLILAGGDGFIPVESRQGQWPMHCGFGPTVETGLCRDRANSITPPASHGNFRYTHRQRLRAAINAAAVVAFHHKHTTLSCLAGRPCPFKHFSK